MMRQTLQPSLIASGSGRTILIAGGERGVIYNPDGYGTQGLSGEVQRKAQQYGVWKEVRQWAKEHPLAVKAINAYPETIHNIADTGYSVRLKLKATAAQNTAPKFVIPSFDANTIFECHVVSENKWNAGYPLLLSQGSGTNAVSLYYGLSQRYYFFRYCNGGMSDITFSDSTMNDDMKIVFNNTKVSINNETKTSQTAFPNMSSYPTMNFGNNFASQIDYAKYTKNGALTHFVVPADENHLCDIITGEIYEEQNGVNAYDFIISKNQ